MTRIYLSPSNQEHNVGKGAYGTEEARMHELAKLLRSALERYEFTVRISRPEWSMAQVVADSNNFRADAHICLHSNAGGASADGSIGFFGSAAGKELTAKIYGYISQVSPGSDEGIRNWSDLYEVRHTQAICAYLELFYHTSKAEVEDFLALGGQRRYAEAIAHGICDYYKVAYRTVLNRKTWLRDLPLTRTADLRFMADAIAKELDSR